MQEKGREHSMSGDLFKNRVKRRALLTLQLLEQVFELLTFVPAPDASKQVAPTNPASHDEVRVPVLVQLWAETLGSIVEEHL